MISNIAPKIPHQGMRNFSTVTARRSPERLSEAVTSSTSAADNVEINSVGLNNTDMKAMSPVASMPAKEKLVYTKRHWTVPLTKSELALIMHQSENKSVDAQTLADNLIKYLRIRSNDSLNIMRGIFKYHRYDMTLLDRYINDRSQKNLKALEIQIENRLFVVGSEKSQKPA